MSISLVMLNSRIVTVHTVEMRNIGNPQNKRMKVEYEVKAPFFIKLLVMLGVALYVLMISGGITYIKNMWMSNNWIGLIAVLLTAFVFPVFALIVFFTKTIFTDSGVIHTNLILRKTRKAYKEIDTVEITGRSDVRLHFVDGTSIKVLTGENYLSKILQILEKHVKLRSK